MEGIIEVSSLSMVDHGLVHVFDHLLQMSVGSGVVVLLRFLGWVVCFPLEMLHFCLHIESSFTGGRGSSWGRVRLLRVSALSTHVTYTSESPQTTSEEYHQEQCEEKDRYSDCEGVMCA